MKKISVRLGQRNAESNCDTGVHLSSDPKVHTRYPYSKRLSHCNWQRCCKKRGDGDKAQSPAVQSGGRGPCPGDVTWDRLAHAIGPRNKFTERGIFRYTSRKVLTIARNIYHYVSARACTLFCSLSSLPRDDLTPSFAIIFAAITDQTTRTESAAHPCLAYLLVGVKTERRPPLNVRFETRRTRQPLSILTATAQKSHFNSQAQEAAALCLWGRAVHRQRCCCFCRTGPEHHFRRCDTLIGPLVSPPTQLVARMRSSISTSFVTMDDKSEVQSSGESPSGHYYANDVRGEGLFTRVVDSFKRDPRANTTITSALNSNGKVYDAEAAATNTAESPLARKLKGRHLQMIAIGGSIG